MKGVPIPAVLALWAAGYTATWIADVLNLPDEKHVQRILAHAREIGDRRAVIHAGGNTRKAEELRKKYPWISTIAALEGLTPIKTPLCRRGHRMTAMNTIKNASGPQCRKCKNIIHQRSRARIAARKAPTCEAIQ